MSATLTDSECRDLSLLLQHVLARHAGQMTARRLLPKIDPDAELPPMPCAHTAVPVLSGPSPEENRP